MLRKLGKLITHNFGLKVLAAVFAVLLWLIVVNVEDPDKTAVFTIPVTIEHEEYLTVMGKTYEVAEDSGEVSFTISGQRSIVEQLTASDFTATANLENIDETLTRVPITVTASRYKDQIEITKKNSFVTVHVENLVEDEYEIEIQTVGDPADSCFVGDTKVSPEKVTVSGPESVMNQIEKAVVSVDVTGAQENIATNAKIQLLDNDGDEIEMDRLTLNRDQAAVDITIQSSGVIPVTYNVTGTPKDGYRYTGVEADVESIEIVGDLASVKAVEALEISSNQLNVDGASEDLTVVIHIPDYLPAGVSLKDSKQEDANVVIHVTGQTTRTVDIPKDQITVNGLDDGLELSGDETTFSVTLTGFEDDLAGLNTDSLTGSIDLSGLSEGTHTVTLTLDETYSEITDASVSVTIVKAQQQDDNKETDTQSDTQSDAQTDTQTNKNESNN